MTSLQNWSRIPQAMRERPQWVLAGASKAPQSVNDAGKLYAASVTSPSEWMTFDNAVHWATQFKDVVTTHIGKNGQTITKVGFDIGYILHEDDPFSCVDLDVKDAVSHPDEPSVWTKPDTFDFYWSIVEHFNTYTERSRSGKGLHVWLAGKIGRGFRRDGIEVYSQERFIICTGDIVLDRPLADRQAMVSNMIQQMRPVETEKFKLVEHPQVDDDWYLLTVATGAANSDKFNQLWKGEWRAMGYPSQSEADYALLSMLAFYSESNEQCRRLFRESALGKRDKATKNDKYLNFGLAGIRERQEREQRADISVLVASMEVSQSRQVESLQSPTTSVQTVPAPPPPEVVAASIAPVSAVVAAASKRNDNSISWPPGLAGQLARFIFDHAPRPVKEVAIVAALGLLAGITGKAWHIPQSGLNLYIVLVGRSGIGKEAMHSGISAMLKACTKDNPLFSKFVSFEKFQSGQGLMNTCLQQPSFVHVNGEWARQLKMMSADDGRNTALQLIRTHMTDLYQKSGPTSIVGGMTYSNAEKNSQSVAGVNYSMIGETTPDAYYRSLTEEMMYDGFQSRFIVIECHAERPPDNEQRIDLPDPALVRALNSMAIQADLHIAKDYSHEVGRTPEASAAIKAFDALADSMIHGQHDESKRQMWNRASLKVQRLCAVLAVGDNWMAPCVTLEHVEWARDIIMRDIEGMSRKLNSGEVGEDDNSRERKIVNILNEYMASPVPAGYKVPDTMRQAGVVPRSYLVQRVSRATNFVSHRSGATFALDSTLQSMVASGYLVEMTKDKLHEAYSFFGRAFHVVKLPSYE